MLLRALQKKAGHWSSLYCNINKRNCKRKSNACDTFTKSDHTSYHKTFHWLSHFPKTRSVCLLFCVCVAFFYFGWACLTLRHCFSPSATFTQNPCVTDKICIKVCNWNETKPVIVIAWLWRHQIAKHWLTLIKKHLLWNLFFYVAMVSTGIWVSMCFSFKSECK